MSYTFHTGTGIEHGDHTWESWSAHVSPGDLPDWVSLDDSGICCHTCEVIVVDKVRLTTEPEPPTSEHIILVALEIAADTRENAITWAEFTLAKARHAQKGSRTHTGTLTAWWTAEDDRADNSDNDSAVFVPRGSQHLFRGGALPREDGHIVTSAKFGTSVLVEILWNTDHDGRVIDPGKEEYPRTFHGPFADMDEASAWMDAYPDDTDVHDMTAAPLNSVRPS